MANGTDIRASTYGKGIINREAGNAIRANKETNINEVLMLTIITYSVTSTLKDKL